MNRFLTALRRFALVWLIVLLLPVRSVGAAKLPTGVTLSKTSVTLLRGKSCTLTAKVVAPKGTKKGVVKWSSSNQKVATVDQKGKVKVVGIGTAKIVAKTENGKKAACKVTGVQYITSSSYVAISTADGIKKYRRYHQNTLGGYLRAMGCVQTAVAIVASSFGKTYTPSQIHSGSASKKYSERYALKKMKAPSYLFGRSAISVTTAAQILEDMGIKTKVVVRWSSTDAAVKQITEHVKQGKPVLLKANNRYPDGIKVANGHHSMVLIGIDKDGKGIFIDPWKGALNYAHGNGRYFKMSVRRFLMNHMTRPSSNKIGAFVTGLSSGGGYILAG